MMFNFEDFGDTGLPCALRRFTAIVLAICISTLTLAAILFAEARCQSASPSELMPHRVDVNGVVFIIQQVDHIGAAEQSIVGWTECSTRRILIERR